MAQQAHITSLEAVDTFRANLVVYGSKTRPLIDDITTEVARTRRWLEEDQKTYWEAQLKRRTRDFEDAQHAVFSARISNLREVSAAEQMALTRAKKGIDEAHHKLKLIEQWRRHLDSMLEPLLRQLDTVQTVVAHELPKAVAYLTQVVNILAEYNEVSLSSGSRPTGSPVEQTPAGTATGTSEENQALGETSPPATPSVSLDADDIPPTHTP